MKKYSTSNILPFSTELKKPGWSYLYAYNLRTIRDIFVFCHYMGEIKLSEFDDLVVKHISPPSNKWVNPNVKRKGRLILEYRHAAEYLGLLKKENGVIVSDFSVFQDEKKAIIESNKDLNFGLSYVSPSFTDSEKKAFLNIILNYERARDFLRWFLDFDEYPDIWSFNISDFRRDAKEIYRGKSDTNEKGSSLIKREIDGLIWQIPTEKPNDYRRMASNLFPKWLNELGLIGTVEVFPEYSDDGNHWHMHYPIKNNDRCIEIDNLKNIIYDSFFADGTQKYAKIWTPHIIYILARDYYLPRDVIEELIGKLYNEDFTHFYLDRASLQGMGGRRMEVKSSYPNVDGYYRSYLKVTRD